MSFLCFNLSTKVPGLMLFSFHIYIPYWPGDIENIKGFSIKFSSCSSLFGKFQIKNKLTM